MCGIFGIIGTPKAAELTAAALHWQQHRGQKATGIVSFDGFEMHPHRQGGLVREVYTSKVLSRLPGAAAVGQNRYATSGTRHPDAIDQSGSTQPFTGKFRFGWFALTHNGTLTNARMLRKSLENEGASFDSDVDTEVALRLIGKMEGRTFLEQLMTALPFIEGAYSFIMLTQKQLVGVRDPLGIRPLSIGRLGSTYMLSSETCVFDALHAEFVRDVEPGEIVVIENGMVSSHRFAPKERPRRCIFEDVYFAFPTSYLDGRNVYYTRKLLGHALAREHPIKLDVVVPVPDSAIPVALGYAEALGIAFDFGLVRNHYWGGRAFIAEGADRDRRAMEKSLPNRAVVGGKRIALLDDSIIRGVTSRRNVEKLFEAGAKEIHILSGSPPVYLPCHWGMDFPSQMELVAQSGMSVQEVCDVVARESRATSVRYLSVEGMYKAIVGEDFNPDTAKRCTACFTGLFPTRLLDQHSAALLH